MKNRDALFACERGILREKNVAVAPNTRLRYKAGMKAFGQSGCVRANNRRGGGPGTSSAKPGFSLVELLIVLALMIILTTMMWGFASESHQHAAQRACQQNLEKIYVALQIYANDFSGRLPASTNAETSEKPLSLLVPRYTVDTSIFICPGSKDSPLPSGLPFANRTISYAYYMGQHLNGAQSPLMSDWQINTLPKKAGDLVFSATGKPPGNNHYKYGGNILFCDGHVELTPPRLPFSLVITQGVVLLNPKPQRP
ncbi:MAG TPA: type II secretion system protein [Verrucomicrobiae bacterium]|nr:type II secretion system protein [Verrucomicrobiae bacterium]